MTQAPVTPVRIASGDARQAIDVFVDAFRDYPVMRHVIGPGVDDYEARLDRLVSFFVMMRVWRDEPMFAVLEDGRAVAAATVTLPGDRPPPAEVEPHRRELWAALGDAARARYDAYGASARQYMLAESHHHLNMIGVRQPYQGRGLARPLLEAVQQLADDDPSSAGVSLTTELAANLPFYQHFGYRVLAHTQIAADFESWVLFRPSR